MNKFGTGSAVTVENRSRINSSSTTQKFMASRAEFVFSSPLMKEIHRKLVELPKANAPLLLQGEKGVGKEQPARLIHRHSREGKPFIAVHCRNLSVESQQAQLFGSHKDRSKATDLDRPGKLQFASGGTLYLAEICDFAPTVQAQLIQALADGTFVWPHSDQRITVDVRLVAATCQNLATARETGKLHADWYSQLKAEVLAIPSLRHRRDEIPLLCTYFLEQISQEYDRFVEPIPEELLKDFAAHEWQGNMSELEGVLKRSVLLQDRESTRAYLTRETDNKPMQRTNRKATKTI